MACAKSVVPFHDADSSVYALPWRRAAGLLPRDVRVHASLCTVKLLILHFVSCLLCINARWEGLGVFRWLV